MGHIIADVSNINPLDLAKKPGLQDEKNVLDKMIEVLSEYASKPGVDEIIAECSLLFYQKLTMNLLLNSLRNVIKLS